MTLLSVSPASLSRFGCVTTLLRLVARAATPGLQVARMTRLASFRIGMAAQGSPSEPGHADRTDRALATHRARAEEEASASGEGRR